MVFGQKSKKPLALRVPVQDWPGLDSQNPSSSSEDEATTSSSGPSTSRTAPGRDAQQRKGSVSHKLPSQQSHETNISWLVLSLATDDAEEQLQTAHMLLDITKDPRNQEAAREAGAVTCLAALLAGGAAHPVVPVALEALALLIVQCKENKDILRTSKARLRYSPSLSGKALHQRLPCWKAFSS